MSIKGNLVSFLIIARNASGTLGTLLKNLEAQIYPAKQIEIILVDSASQDDTKQIMMQFQAAHRNEFYDILVLDNPKMILPCGWNVALREAHGDVILRVDAHSTLPPDFIACNMANFANGEKIVGGPAPVLSLRTTLGSVLCSQRRNRCLAAVSPPIATARIPAMSAHWRMARMHARSSKPSAVTMNGWRAPKTTKCIIA